MPPPPSPEAARAGRAVGAMFFSVFSGLWIVLGLAIALPQQPLWGWALPMLPALALLGWALAVYRCHRATRAAHEALPEAKRRAKLFHWINGGQWVAIFVLGNVLRWVGWAGWFLPMIPVVGAGSGWWARGQWQSRPPPPPVCRTPPSPTPPARAQFMYRDTQGARLTLYVSVLPPGPPVPAGFGQTRSFYWREGRLG